MPAIPIAESSAPIVVGMSATSSAISVDEGDGGAGVARRTGAAPRRPRGRSIVRPASRMPRAISFGVLRRVGALDERDHPVQEGLARLLGDLDDDAVRQHAGAAGHGAAVAAGLADHRGGLAGDRRLVDRGDALDHGAVAGDDLAGLDHDDVAAAQVRRPGFSPPSRSVATVVGAHRAERRRPGPCRALRRSPRRGCRTRRSARARRDRERRTRPGRSPAPDVARRRSVRATAIVVNTAPTSTTNITGLRTMRRGSSLRRLASSAGLRTAGSKRMRLFWPVAHRAASLSIARLSSSTLTPGSPSTPSEAAVGVRRRRARGPAPRQPADGRDAAGLDARVGGGDVRVDVRGGGEDRVARRRLPASDRGCRAARARGRRRRSPSSWSRRSCAVRAEVRERGAGGVVAGRGGPALEVAAVGDEDRVAVGVLLRLPVAAEHRAAEVLPDQLASRRSRRRRSRGCRRPAPGKTTCADAR